MCQHILVMMNMGEGSNVQIATTTPNLISKEINFRNIYRLISNIITSNSQTPPKDLKDGLRKQSQAQNK